MSSSRAFRFGLQASALPGGTGGTTGTGWRNLARQAEDLGFATLTVADHLDDQLAVMPAMQAAADATTTLRVGALVLCNDYRHPVVLAKEVATLDVLSGGRMEVGVGAGWMTTDYESAGIGLDPPGLRIRRLTEALDVLEGLRADGPSHRRRRALPGDRARRPAQAGAAALAAAPARRWSPADAGRSPAGAPTSSASTCPSPRGSSTPMPDPTAPPSGPTRSSGGSATAPGALRRPRTAGARVPGPADRRPAGRGGRVRGRLRPHPRAVARDPHALVGSTAEMVEDLLARRERWGISYIGVGVEALEAMAPVVSRLAGT